MNSHLEITPTIIKINICSLTYIGHLLHRSNVGVFGEFRLVVIDVMDFDGELRWALQVTARYFIYGFGAERVGSFLLTVQPPGGMQVARVFINDKNTARSLSCKNVPYSAIFSVLIRVQLWEAETSRC